MRRAFISLVPDLSVRGRRCCRTFPSPINCKSFRVSGVRLAGGPALFYLVGLYSGWAGHQEAAVAGIHVKVLAETFHADLPGRLVSFVHLAVGGALHPQTGRGGHVEFLTLAVFPLDQHAPEHAGSH